MGCSGVCLKRYGNAGEDKDEGGDCGGVEWGLANAADTAKIVKIERLKGY